MASKAFRLAELQERRERSRRAEIDAVLAEFGGNTDAMAEALLHCRQWLRRLVDAGEMIQQGKPFIVMGAGPYYI